MSGERTSQVRGFINKHQKSLVISTWCEAEFYGALGRQVRDGLVPRQAANRLVAKFNQHLQQGLFHLLALDNSTIISATKLTRQFSLGIKAPDALHLAAVQTEVLTLVTSDQTMTRVAQQLSLNVNLLT